MFITENIYLDKVSLGSLETLKIFSVNSLGIGMYILCDIRYGSKVSCNSHPPLFKNPGYALAYVV